MFAATNRTVLALLAVMVLLTACAAPEPKPTSRPSTTTEQATGYEEVHAWPLSESIAASAFSPDGSFALLAYKGVAANERFTLHRFEFESGESSRVRVSRGSDGVMFRAVTEAKAIAIAEGGQTFLANWPAYLALIDSESGSIESVTSIANADHGMTSFNVLEFGPDYVSAFGLGSDLVRVDLSNKSLAYHRDMPASQGGRSLAVLAPDQVAIGNTAFLAVMRAGADAPDCTVEGTITGLEGSPDGSKLVGALYDQESRSHSIVVWSSADCSELLRWAPEAKSVVDLAWLPDGQTIASAELDGQLRFWDASTGQLDHSMRIEEDAGFAVHFSADGSRMLTHTMWGDQTLRFYQRR